MFHYFRRGNSLYWNENAELVRDAHAAALDDSSWPEPGAVESSELHPSRIAPDGVAWRINGINYPHIY